MTDVFDSAWLPAMFTREREEVRERLATLQVDSANPTVVEHSLVSRIGQHIEHLLRTLRETGSPRSTRELPRGTTTSRQPWLPAALPTPWYRPTRS